jgi:hypothetical protein
MRAGASGCAFELLFVHQRMALWTIQRSRRKLG